MILMKELIRITTLISLIISTSCVGEPPLEIVKQWNLVNFNFQPNLPANDKNYFDPEKIVTTGFEVSGDRIFLATPRLFSGVPATLSYVSRDNAGDSPVLKAYPDWAHHTVSLNKYNCSEIGLISVYRLKIDSCNRLWAVDAGVSRSLEDFEVTCPPKILIFDLNTDQVVRRIDFPKEVVRDLSLFTNIIIDETLSKPENHCDDVVVYMSDTVEPAIVVYDSERDLTWRLSHPSMYADDDFAISRIGNDRFNLSDGIVGMAFDVKSRIVYFQPLATDRLFSVPAAALRKGPLPVGQDLPVKLVGKKSSQGIGIGASPYGGNIFFAPFTETAVAQFNPKTNEQRVIAHDYEALQFIADFKVSPHDPNALYFVSSKFHRFFLKNINPNEINTRIIRIGNVVQSTPYNYASNFHAIPQFTQNSLIPQHHFPTPGPSFQGFHHPSYPVASPSPQSVVNYPNPNYSFYNFVNQYPTSRPYPAPQSQPQPTYATAPQASPISFPSYSHQTPVTSSFFNFRGSTPYAFDRFDMIDRRNSYSSYNHHNLNAGESLPQPTAYANINFEGLKGEIYRPTRNVSLLHRH